MGGSVLGNPEGMGGNALGNPEGRTHAPPPSPPATGAVPPSASRTGTGCRGAAGVAGEIAGKALAGTAGIGAAGGIDALVAELGVASPPSAVLRRLHATLAS
jgi:hypothetical protein